MIYRVKKLSYKYLALLSRQQIRVIITNWRQAQNLLRLFFLREIFQRGEG